MTESTNPMNYANPDAEIANNAVIQNPTPNAQDAFDQECAEFQALMPKRIEAGEDLQTFPHMLTCERCRALVQDLEYIAQAARELMPIEEEPRDELWTQIQLAIERGEA